jgi:hypothetical protein
MATPFGSGSTPVTQCALGTPEFERRTDLVGRPLLRSADNGSKGEPVSLSHSLLTSALGRRGRLRCGTLAVFRSIGEFARTRESGVFAALITEAAPTLGATRLVTRRANQRRP